MFRRFPYSSLLLQSRFLSSSSTSQILVLNQNTNKWRDFLLKCKISDINNNNFSKQQQLSAISVTNEQWNAANNANQLDLENLSSVDAFSMICFLSFQGHTPWALSAWRRFFVMKKSSSLDDERLSMLCYPILALSHLSDAVFLLNSENKKLSDLLVENNASALNICRKSLELARTLMNLYCDEVILKQRQQQETSSRTRRISPSSSLLSRNNDADQETRFAAKIGLFLELVFVVEKNINNINNNDKNNLLSSLTSISSTEQESFKFWTQKLFSSEDETKESSTIFQNVITKTVNEDKTSSANESLWKTFLSDTDISSILAQTLLKHLPHFAPLVPSREKSMKDETSPEHLMKRLIMPHDSDFSAEFSRKYVLQVMRLLFLQTSSSLINSKNVLPLKQWRAIAVNLKLITKTCCFGDDEEKIVKFLDGMKKRIDSENTGTSINFINVVSEVGPVLFQLLITNNTSTSFCIQRQIITGFEEILSWALEKSLSTASLKIGSVKSDSALLFRCQQLFITLCYIRQHNNLHSDDGKKNKNMLAITNQQWTKTITNLLLRFPHQISMWTLPAMEDSRFRVQFVRNIIFDNMTSQESSENFPLWLDRLKIFFCILDEVIGLSILLNNTNTNAMYQHKRTSTAPSLLHKLVSDFYQVLSENNILLDPRLKEFLDAVDSRLQNPANAKSFRISFHQQNGQVYLRDILQILKQKQNNSSQEQIAKFRSLMDPTVRNKQDSWHEALAICVKQLSTNIQHQHLPKVKDCHDRELFLTSPAFSLLAIVNQNYWLHLRRMISVGFETGCWQSACGVLNTLGTYSSTISAGNFLYWRSVALLRRTGRWQELMKLLVTKENQQMLLPDDSRENDLVASSSKSSRSHLLLAASICSAVQRSEDFHFASHDHQQQNHSSSKEDKQQALLRIISTLRSTGFDTKFNHAENSQQEFVSPEMKVYRTGLASMAKVCLRCELENPAAALLIPACHLIDENDAIVNNHLHLPEGINHNNNKSLTSQDREFYKNANSVFRELVKKQKWPRSEWQLGLKFARHNGRNDLAASIQAKFCVGI